MVQERAEEIIGVFFEAIEAGDRRAAEAWLTRVYGKPVEKLEVKRPETVADVEAMTLDEIRVLRASMENGSSW